MAFIVWVVRVLVILLVIRFVLRLISSAQQAAKAPRRPAGRPQERLGGALVRDPHCGTYVPEERAIVTGAGDNRQFFCSADCRDKWQATR